MLLVSLNFVLWRPRRFYDLTQVPDSLTTLQSPVELAGLNKRAIFLKEAPSVWTDVFPSAELTLELLLEVFWLVQHGAMERFIGFREMYRKAMILELTGDKIVIHAC